MVRLGLRDVFALKKDLNRNYLWHHTGYNSLADILRENKIGFDNKWTSFTRRDDMPWQYQLGKPQVALQLDRDKMRHNYKISPYNYQGKFIDHPFSWDEARQFYGWQAEERIFGPLRNLENYLESIIVPQYVLEEIMKEIDDYGKREYNSHEKLFMRPPEDLKRILEHPKLNVVEKAPWITDPSYLSPTPMWFPSKMYDESQGFIWGDGQVKPWERRERK